MKLITLAKRYKYICYWCKKKFELEDLSRDHIIPLNDKHKNRNCGKCVLSCIFCNQKRGNKPFDYFLEELAKEKKRHKEELERLWSDENNLFEPLCPKN